MQKKLFIQTQAGRTFGVIISDMATEAIGSGRAMFATGYRTKRVWCDLAGRQHRYYAIPAIGRVVDVVCAVRKESLGHVPLYQATYQNGREI